MFLQKVVLLRHSSAIGFFASYFVLRHVMFGGFLVDVIFSSYVGEVVDYALKFGHHFTKRTYQPGVINFV